MNNIYIARAIYSFGNTALSLFLPLYLWQIQVPLWQIFLAFAVMDFVHMLLVLPTGGIINKFGLPNVFGAGIVLSVSFYSAVHSFDMREPLTLFFWSVFYGVGSAFYWTAWHCMLALKTTKGSDMSNMKIIASVMSLAAPVLAGVVITYMSFSMMFFIFGFIMMLAIVPVATVTYQYGQHSPQPTLDDVLKVANWRDSVAMGVGFIDNNVENIVWPLFMGATGLFSILALGSLYTGISVAMLAITPVIGKIIDRDEHDALTYSSYGMFGLGLLRLLGIVFQPFLIGLTLLCEVFSTAENSTIDHLCYSRARETELFSYIAYREIIINFGTTVFFIICAATQNYYVMFTISALASLTYVLFLREPDVLPSFEEAYELDKSGLYWVMKKKYLRKYRRTCGEQLASWYVGKPIHNEYADECCPDFSCCHPEMLWPKEKREKFITSSHREQEEMLVSELPAHPQVKDKNVHFAKFRK